MPIKNFPPVSKVHFPTVPLSYPHDESGIYFVSQHYWFQFQQNPQPALVLFSDSKEDSPIIYHYSLSAFGRRDIIPESSILPIAVATIEQTNLANSEMSALFAQLGSDIPLPLMKGLFVKNKRLNLGKIEQEISTQEAVGILLNEMKNVLDIKEIKYVGDINAACKLGFIPYAATEKQGTSKKAISPLAWGILIILAVLLFVWLNQ